MNRSYFYYFSDNRREPPDKPRFGDFYQNNLSLYQVSFFPIIPTLSYKVFFDREERMNGLGRKEKQPRAPRYRRLLYL